MLHSLRALNIHPRQLAANWQFLILASLGLLLFLNLQQTNNQAESSFKIRKLEVSRDTLREEIRNLTWEVSSARSLATVQERARELSLGTPKDVSFVQAGFSSVALSGNQGEKN